MSFRELDLVRVKGKDDPVAIFEPLLTNDALSLAGTRYLSVYHEAIGRYRSRDWDKAEDQLSRLIVEDADRKIYRLYLERIAEFRRNPPPSDWDNVIVFKEK